MATLEQLTKPTPSIPPWRTRSRSTSVSGRLDKVVFGVTAALAIGFLAWGFIDTGSLGSASDSALGWTMHTMGWLFVLIATAFVVFVIWLPIGPLRRHHRSATTARSPSSRRCRGSR